jgi:decaprenyl-phosphate phosphoribosyltransferase
MPAPRAAPAPPTLSALPAEAPVMRAPLLRLLRPAQWVKNGFVLAPLLFAGVFRDGPAVGRAAFAAALFCAAASLAYVMNDLRDVADDRRHPAKRLTRPLASGAVSVQGARALAAVLALLVLAGGIAMPEAGGVVALYLAVNLAYSAGLKRVPVVDLFCVASGFVLRVWAGALAVRVPLSTWMLVTTLCLALYLAALKRRQELRSTVQGGGRAVLGAYSPVLLERYAQTAACGAIVFYALWVVDVRPQLVATVPAVLFGFFRYAYLVEARDEGECPTDTLWRDPPLLLTLAAWTAMCLWAMW